MSREAPTRRGVLRAALLAGVGVAAVACDQISRSPSFRPVVDLAEAVTERVQRFLFAADSLAPEYTEADISTEFRANGSTNPANAAYQAHVAAGFADWALEVAGLVDTPLTLSLDDLRAMPSRTQITRHDCVEGWSCIGKWKGVPLAAVLDRAGLQPSARYLVFRCADELERTLDRSGQYYESIAVEDAFHAQTILAYDMNDEVLSVAHGAPIRLRLERQLGYKMAKYVMRIEAVADFSTIGRGRGGFWEDRGYQWYAGI